MMVDFGILITHGTDTLSWTFSYLRYALKNLPCNVVLTGAQIPMEALFSYSDGYANVKSSILLLQKLLPPHICVVFNYGKNVLSSRVDKIRKWNPVAFYGEITARIEWGEFTFLDNRYSLKGDSSPLRRIYLVRTGGTIEMLWDAERAIYKPGGDSVAAYLANSSEFRKNFKDLSTETIEPLRDSSDLTFQDWEEIGKKVKQICINEKYKNISLDTNFSDKIYLVHLTPFFKHEHYKKFFNTTGADGFIIFGYGAGNVNIQEKSGYSILPFINECMSKEIPVVICSHVPLEIGDFEYECGYVPLEKGAIPALDRPLPDAYVKLSYLMGHKEALSNFAKKIGRTFLDVVRASFVAGTKFRTHKAREKYLKLFNIPYSKTNYFIGEDFDAALEKIIPARKTCKRAFLSGGEHDKCSN